jgi:prephenate dehydrogenase
MTTLLVVGVGLIGASIALGCREHGLFEDIVGIDSEVGPLDLPLTGLSRTVRADDRGAVEAALSSCDLVVLATPVLAIEDWLARALDHAPAVTDCGSTKRHIVESARGHARFRRFVPGHPMAGGQGGRNAADPELFGGRHWILCDDESDADARARVEALVRGLGAELVRMSAVEHDAAVAMTSHVPKLLASALVVLSVRANAVGAAGPGYANAARVAGGTEGVWRDILTTNADEVAGALRALLAELEPIAQDLERHPPVVGRALELLSAARRCLK